MLLVILVINIPDLVVRSTGDSYISLEFSSLEFYLDGHAPSRLVVQSSSILFSSLNWCCFCICFALSLWFLSSIFGTGAREYFNYVCNFTVLLVFAIKTLDCWLCSFFTNLNILVELQLVKIKLARLIIYLLVICQLNNIFK